MKVLVVNCGSSSLKYQVLEMDNSTLLAKGLVGESVLTGSVMKHEKIRMDEVYRRSADEEPQSAIGCVLKALT